MQNYAVPITFGLKPLFIFGVFLIGIGLNLLIGGTSTTYWSSGSVDRLGNVVHFGLLEFCNIVDECFTYSIIPDMPIEQKACAATAIIGSILAGLALIASFIQVAIPHSEMFRKMSAGFSIAAFSAATSGVVVWGVKASGDISDATKTSPYEIDISIDYSLGLSAAGAGCLLFGSIIMMLTKSRKNALLK